jgi:hypothetical protein
MMDDEGWIDDGADGSIFKFVVQVDVLAYENDRL